VQIMARAASETVILEDDVYRHLWYDAPAPPPLQAYAAPAIAAPAVAPPGAAPPGAVIRLGSFSKILAPGLRLGWLIARPDIVRRCAGSGLLDSGGGQSHFAAHVAGAFIHAGLLDSHLERLRAAYRSRRDALLSGLAGALPANCSFSRAGGGFFTWVQLPEGMDSTRLLPLAERAGVSYAPGARFYADGGERYLRLAFSLLPEDELREGARRLGAAIRDAQRKAPLR
jgi:DNA-binding transcriptional MocR family regulator